mmetsp:Transcript_9744/g.17769  ORF Transcript_9744/g.17769 Transcript_9744/m.17769 type:complete len:906 (+) Transcript_9744:236-2953(+)|eukprot:CAMPEP_0197533768 /NCGR_PEP_ID=MMETSP1318-20131121/44612_1 /TAXON_ID=552666 /ORGANISM="Partenskyella glossopodia, Strain RCC365" /LENGTH=905 /DNA_ID=CAMNT_0043090773 /DNA_START=156 /DNA_END=2873 /DNA_ORIENTATION=+
MSLFQCREWWNFKPDTPEECDTGCMVVCDIDNSGDEQNLKIVSGTFKGILRIFAPRTQGFRASDLRLEQDLGAPILQVAAGKFIPDSDELALAVLHPRLLVIYSVRANTAGFTEKTTKDDVYYSLDFIYKHTLTRTACNMCYGPFGKKKGGDSICVQSMDGQIFVLEQDCFAFARFLNNFLLPGPIAYVKEIDSIVTVNSEMQVECYKYRTLGTTVRGRQKESADIKEESADIKGGIDTLGLRSSRSKIQTAWSSNVGEHCLGVSSVQLAAEGARPISPTGRRVGELLLVGENTMFRIDTDGKMIDQRRFGYSPACFARFPVGSSATIDSKGERTGGKDHVVVASGHKSLLVYDEKQLLWSATCPFVPVEIAVGSFGGVRGMIVMLNDEGSISVTYMGTDPISQVTSMAETKELDYESMDEEHKRLLKIIRSSNSSHLEEPTDKITVQAEVPQTLDSGRINNEDAAVDEQGHQICVKVKLHIKYSGPGKVTDVVANLDTPEAIIVESNTLTIPTIQGSVGASSTTPVVYPVSFFVSRKVLPSNSKVEAVFSYTSPEGAPRTTYVSFSVPLCLVCRVVAPVNVATFAFNLQSNKECPALSTLFGDVFRPAAAAQPELVEQAEKVLTLNFYAGPDVTIRLSKTKTKFRIQSGTFESLWLVTNQFVRRLVSYCSRSQKSEGKGASGTEQGDYGGLQLTFPDPLPLKDFFRVLDAHFDIRIQIMTLEYALEAAAHQFRTVQKRLVARYKTKNPSPLLDLDLLLHDSFMRLNTLSDKMEVQKKALDVACSNLSCATHLLLLLIRFKFQLDSKNAYLLEAYLSPVIENDTDSQGWEERTKAAMLHLLRSVLVKSGTKNSMPALPMTLMSDTSKLKRNIQLVCERLSKGYRFVRASRKKGKGKSPMNKKTSK